MHYFFLVKSANHKCVFPVRLSIIKLYEKIRCIKIISIVIEYFI